MCRKLLPRAAFAVGREQGCVGGGDFPLQLLSAEAAPPPATHIPAPALQAPAPSGRQVYPRAFPIPDKLRTCWANISPPQRGGTPPQLQQPSAPPL